MSRRYEVDLLPPLGEIKDLVIKILDYYSRNNKKSVVTFMSVSKQWQRCIYELPFIGISDRLFLADYDDFSLSSFTNLKGMMIVGDSLPLDWNNETFKSRLCEKLAPLRAKIIDHLVLRKPFLLPEFFLSRYFGHIRTLTFVSRYPNKDFYNLKASLPRLECVRVSKIEVITDDMSHLDDVPLVDDMDIRRVREILNGMFARTGKSIIRFTNPQNKSLLHTVECFLIKGKLDVDKPVKTTTTCNGEFFSAYDGTFDKDFNSHGRGKYLNKRSTVFEGEWVNGKFEGKGNVTYIDGVTYQGDWINAKRHGKGVLSVPHKFVYSGDFVNDLIEGQGLYNFANGHTYEGYVKDGAPNGMGKFTCSTSSYVGHFENGRLQGKGVYHLSSPASGESYYKGEFKDHKPHGKGKLVLGNKEILKGQFSFGKFIEGRLSTPDDKYILIGSFDMETLKFKGKVYGCHKEEGEEEEEWLTLSDYIGSKELLVKLSL